MKQLIKTYFRLTLLILLLLPHTAQAQAARPAVLVLNYHDVGTPTSPYTVTKANLEQHFKLLQEQGFHPISPELYLAACKGEAELPAKPVLLTFDDGYRSFYTDVYPLLQQYHYPALLSVVTAWQQTGAPADIGQLATWEQLRTMEASGLVTIGSHSHNSHRFIPINSFGDRAQALASREYRDGQYETAEQYRQRVQNDMEQTQAALTNNLGHPAKFYVWPYGEYTDTAVELANAAGFELTFALDDETSTAIQPSAVQRTIIYDNPTGPQFLQLLSQTPKPLKPLKIAQLDLDMLANTNRTELETNIDEAIALLQRSQVNTVFLQAFADEKGNGNIEQVYFYTTAAPVKQELFSHVAARLQSAGFQVYAWIPTLAGQWLIQTPDDQVQALIPEQAGWYNRATPFSPHVREQLISLVNDLAAYSQLDGILFQDDVYLNDYEDASPAAQAAYQAALGQPLTAAALADFAYAAKLTDLKIHTLNKLTLDLAAEVRKIRPRVKVARNLYPLVVTDPKASAWLGQKYDDYLNLYNYTVIMAYPYMEQAADPKAWLTQLAEQAMTKPGAREKTIFKLQSYDWSKKRWLAGKTLSEQAQTLKSNGVIHLAYYPLNVFSPKQEPLPF
ncbi:hypothetical protein SPFL3102_01563 [Sporomusaceae bacterium FL31]|nr:hypothetical protein SPFL3101_03197 [Sporomusaceae bacterium FL31]GCE33754.1 hypothetical protein SPFL3102_01563 [Sporomusaceae bacterium]